MGLRDTLPLLPGHDSRDSAASWLLTLRLCNRRSSCPGRSPAGPGLVHTGANHSAFTEPGDTTRKTRTTTLVSGAVPIHYRRPVAEAASGDRWPEDPVVGATTGPTMRRPRLPPGRSPAPTTAGQHRCGVQARAGSAGGPVMPAEARTWSRGLAGRGRGRGATRVPRGRGGADRPEAPRARGRPAGRVPEAWRPRAGC